MLSAVELAQLQTDAEVFLSDSCVIWRDTLSAGPFSAGGSAIASAAGTVACRLRPSAINRETALGGQIQASNTWILTVPVDADVRASDRIVYSGRVLEPIGALGPKTNDVTQRVLCIEIGEGTQ